MGNKENDSPTLSDVSITTVVEEKIQRFEKKTSQGITGITQIITPSGDVLVAYEKIKADDERKFTGIHTKMGTGRKLVLDVCYVSEISDSFIFFDTETKEEVGIGYGHDLDMVIAYELGVLSTELMFDPKTSKLEPNVVGLIKKSLIE